MKKRSSNKRLPKFFSCPRCGKEAVRVELFRNESRAVVSCENCGLKWESVIKPRQREIDVYNMFTEKLRKWWSESKERKNVKKD